MDLTILTFSSLMKSGCKPYGRLHGHESNDLKHMVLHDVPHHAGFFVEGSPVLDPYVFGHRYLHVVDVAPVPDLLEDRVGEAEEDDVIHRFFGEIMVYPVYLILVEGVYEDLVQARPPISCPRQRAFR